MPKWIEKKQGWLPISGKRQKPERKPERMYSISEVAELLGVSRKTVFKWLSIDEPADAVIPPNAWMKLPSSGHIRIHEWIVLKLQKGDL